MKYRSISDEGRIVATLSALASPHRLRVYRVLIEAGPAGLSAGEVAARVGLAPSSLTFHLQHLHRAGLVTQERASRQLIYAADFGVMRRLVAYLTENCCTAGAACGSGRERRRSRGSVAA